MNVFVYETESVSFENGGVEVIVIIAPNRDAADQILLNDPDCWVSDIDHLKKCYKVEEKTLVNGSLLLRANMEERLDKHRYA